jgi:hypothetical protein
MPLMLEVPTNRTDGFFFLPCTSCSNFEKKLTTLNKEMESIKTQLLNMSAKPKRSNETNSEDESDWSLVHGKKKTNP